MAAMLEQPVSLQSESELTWKKGASAEQGQRLLHAAAGLQQGGALVRDGDARMRPAGELRLDLSGEMVDIDDRLLDAGLSQPVERMVEHRLAADPHERLGQACR